MYIFSLLLLLFSDSQWNVWFRLSRLNEHVHTHTDLVKHTHIYLYTSQHSERIIKKNCANFSYELKHSCRKDWSIEAISLYAPNDKLFFLLTQNDAYIHMRRTWNVPKKNYNSLIEWIISNLVNWSNEDWIKKEYDKWKIYVWFIEAITLIAHSSALSLLENSRFSFDDIVIKYAKNNHVAAALLISHSRYSIGFCLCLCYCFYHCCQRWLHMRSILNCFNCSFPFPIILYLN